MEQQPHVVIFPYDEQGHVTPAFALGRVLASRGVRVTGVLTATRYANSRSTLGDSGLFRIVAIPDGAADDGKQDDVCFQHSLQKLEPGLEGLMLRMQPRPSCLISDLLYPWSQDLADRLCLPRILLCLQPAILLLLVLHFPALISKGLLPFQPVPLYTYMCVHAYIHAWCLLGCSPFAYLQFHYVHGLGVPAASKVYGASPTNAHADGMEDEVIDFIPGLPKEFRLADVPVDFLSRDRRHLEIVPPAERSMKRAAGLVINTIYELEPDVFDALSAEGFSTYAVGPMSSMDWKGICNQMPSLIAEDEECLLWLDSQHRGAVIYVALGSIVSLTEEEIQEVALGLEACGQPFLWVLRCPRTGGIDLMSALPAGFQERTKERGCVIAWAPQTAVLAHASVGCFLTHCGMGSVLEALWAGVPMIGGFCKISEQNTNLRLLTKEWGVAMALQDRNVSPLPPLRCAIERCVKEVIDGEKGVALSQNALQLKAALRKAVEPNGSSYMSLAKLSDVLSTIPSRRK